MTKEEAAQNIKRFSDTLDTLSESLLIESLHMAIEALSADTVPIEKYHELQHQFVMLGAAFVDLTEAVRCKDCKQKAVTEDGEYNPEDIVCDYWATDGLRETDFCSYGERKESEDEK